MSSETTTTTTTTTTLSSSFSNINIDTTKPVLVTGATGYVAGVLVSQLLDLGLTVHAAVRCDPRNNNNRDKLKHLSDLVANKEKTTSGTIKFFQADLLDEGSYDDGMKGCSVVFHTASPFVLNVTDPFKELIDPAVMGTQNVLNSVNRTPSVRRVVLTSSTAAMYTDATETHYDQPGNKNVLNEENWNTTATIDYQPYYLSKVKAEQTAWVMAGSQTQWSLVTINPGFVCGPGIKYHATAESYDIITNLGGGKMKNGCPNYAICIVDVRDVAQAHILAAYNPASHGRNIVVAQNTNLMGIADIIRQKYIDYPLPTTTINKTFFWFIGPYLGIPGLTRRGIQNNVDIILNIDNTKSLSKELGIQYRPIQETLHDMYQQLIDEGIIHK